MAVSSIRKTFRDTAITLADSGATNSITLTTLTSSLSVTIPGATVVHNLERGAIASTPHLRYGDERPMTFSLEAVVTDFSNGTDEILADLFMKNDIGAGWTSTLGANAEVMALDLSITIEGTDHGDSADHAFTLANCVMEGTFDESGEFWTLSMSGTSYAARPSSLT